ncbi:putative iron-sulfur cluster-binding metallochaperone [Galenea microaerophila]
MSCCSSNGCTRSQTAPSKLTCPLNGKAYRTVPKQTLLHHLKAPWRLTPELLDEPFAFCENPECEVIYFNAKGQIFTQQDIRTPVGHKSIADDALICYCFGVDRKTARSQPEVKEYVVQQTKSHLCACESRNPSGRCCLKDF